MATQQLVLALMCRLSAQDGDHIEAKAPSSCGIADLRLPDLESVCRQ
jgi:hypothetical protein